MCCPALIRKVYEAKLRGRSEVVVWGTGKPLREFLFSNDFADACVHLMTLDERSYRDAAQREIIHR